jgi:glycosyltransferase involved in cell wall biosynthesis
VTLRIAWAGPWNVRSSITMNFGVDVVAALAARGHAVEILRSEVGPWNDIAIPQTPWSVRHFAETWPESRHAAYDVVIANLGDHYGYHGALAPVLLTTEPVVIFHDAYLANYCAGLAENYPDPAAALRTMVAAAYGEGAMAPDEPYWLDLPEMMRRRPMPELFAAHAAGSVVHAAHYRDRIASVAPGPVAQIPLSSRDVAMPPPPSDRETLVVATIGHVNPNKQVTEVIRAIGLSAKLRERCRYKIIGACEEPERRRIARVMRAHGVTSVEFTGWVDDDALHDLMADVDVVCCLRHPVLEGASGSVIVAMLAARPVLVSDQGVYAELRDDVALKCRPGEEAADVMRHLEALLEDRDARRDLGARARAYALQMHAPSHYADKLISLVERVVASEPALRTGAQFGAILQSFGLRADDAAVRLAARSLTALLG